MKRLALAPLLVAAGCLYTGGLNRPPEVKASMTETRSFKGSALSITATATDDEDLLYQIKVDFTVESADPDQPLDPCDYDLAVPSPYTHAATVRFYRPGIFIVKAVASDHHNSMSSPASVMVTIYDAPPMLSANAMLVPTLGSNSCGLYTAGEAVPLRLDGTISDSDRVVGASCDRDETMVYTWRISGQPGSARPRLTTFFNGACTPPTASSTTWLGVASETTQVCLWTDATNTSSTSMYGVILEISDGTNTIRTSAADLPIAADAPPCITGTELPAGMYVLDRAQKQTFEVEGVLDDRDGFGSSGLTYAWSVWRDTEAIWRPVPLHPQSSYTLDGADYGVGEKVRLRVEAIDRTGIRASCPTDDDDCTVMSCASAGQACHKWKTWDLELR